MFNNNENNDSENNDSKGNNELMDSSDMMFKFLIRYIY